MIQKKVSILLEIDLLKASLKQKYRTDWEKIPELHGWLSGSCTKNKMAFCKLCNCNLEGMLSDLRKHVSTKKHSDNAKLISQHRPMDSLPNTTSESQVR